MDLLEAKLILIEAGPNGDGMFIGYEREAEEARANGGFDDLANSNEQFTNNTIINKDEGYSKKLQPVCQFHIHEDKEAPRKYAQNLQGYLIQDCMQRLSIIILIWFRTNAMKNIKLNGFKTNQEKFILQANSNII